ncbi:light-regulated signal transduction histidine kinase (bacteriophytochrome) [Pontibacter aydingkolensis]|uniref:histidine kinase n=1 Tax=Pontibacter aydingkolensis TaxID=1911536 RepID=A0ABS7CUX5_9BACT|nr:ATP-binding protein [Pontibacter aydingkolensis]MBW7467277.1 GAF domain-containing protein [Pontibacter aydingkolensis]
MQNYKNLKVDLSNCDKEPIHIIGRIQPHGFMLILDRSTLEVVQVSENIGDFLDTTPANLLGKTLAHIISDAEYATLVNQVYIENPLNPQAVTLQQRSFFGFIHFSENKLVLECEPLAVSATENRLENALSFSQFQTELNALPSFMEQTFALVNYVQRLLDYDRVMLYVFDQDWHGEVIAERVKPGVHSYLHHHFPATDIPAQARELLLKKCVRQIPDVHATAVDIVPYFDPATNAPTNIIQSELRNPSEIHLEYLRNMDVGATLSVSVIVQGKLWGIIACQHQTARFINFWKRQTCLVTAITFANTVLANQEKTDQQVIAKYKAAEVRLIEQTKAAGDFRQGLFNETINLLHLTEGHGAAMYLNGSLTTIGKTPEPSELMEILEWLSEREINQVTSTRELSRYLPDAVNYRSVASGVLAIEISKYNKEFILFFKPEIYETRIWAGNPEKPVIAGNTYIHPRESFSHWEDIVRGKSLPWSLSDITIAQILQKDIIALLMQKQAMLLKELNEELNASAEELQLKNRKLEDFAQIIAHNLRSPMSNIRGLYDLYKAEPSPETGVEVMDRMSKMIDNMSATIDDLNLVLRSAVKQELAKEAVPIAELIQKEKQNLQATIQTTNAQIHTDLKVPVLHVPKVYLQSILHNLLSNALKYSAENRQPEIMVRSWVAEDQVYLTVSDNGLGIDLDKVQSKMFGLYNTFHRNKDSKGIGLYLTKTQADLIGGKIGVESTVNKGTTFTISFPASVAIT